jgi:hypothetical protein
MEMSSKYLHVLRFLQVSFRGDNEFIGKVKVV